MALKKVWHTLWTLLFFVHSLVLTLSIPELVLCVAEDHVQLEVKNLDNHCHHETTPAGYSAVQQHYHADDCRDIPLFQHARHGMVKQQSPTINFPGQMGVCNRSQERVPFQRSLTTRPCVISDLTLRATRSVILLI